MGKPAQKENKKSFFHKVYVFNRFLAVAGFTLSFNILLSLFRK
tara:strand:- start:1153 stop:1281 length:129 start_codon:yes stop_codon:yes gene_type:complete